MEKEWFGLWDPLIAESVRGKNSRKTVFEAQVNYFTEKIASNPLWNYAGIYSDQGKTATSTKKRDSFNDMLEDCYAGT